MITSENNSSRSITLRRRLGSTWRRMERKTSRLPSGSMIRNSMTAAENVSIERPGRTFQQRGEGRNITKVAGFGERPTAPAAGDHPWLQILSARVWNPDSRVDEPAAPGQEVDQGVGVHLAGAAGGNRASAPKREAIAALRLAWVNGLSCSSIISITS